LTVYGAALDFSGHEALGIPSGEQSTVELLDYAFFDDDTTVLLVRTDGELENMFVPATLDVNGSGFCRNRVPCSSNAHIINISFAVRSKCNGRM
jgi:hypothetical protein